MKSRGRTYGNRAQDLDVLLVGDAASIHIRRLAFALAGAGRSVVVAGTEGDAIPSVKVRTLSRGGRWRRLHYILAVPRLARLLRRSRPALVNAHYVSSFGLIAALALRLAFPVGSRPPLVTTAWGTDLLVTSRASRSRAALAAFALRSSELITGDSEDLRQEAARLAPGVPFHRFIFGPPAELLEKVRSPERRIISPRRLDPEMRVPLIVEAFLRAQQDDPVALAGWSLTVAGAGSELAQVQRAARSRSEVQLVGQLAPRDLHELLLRTDIMISVPVSDATSAALLEAMAAGVMPIVNDLPANREWVDHAVGGIVPKDPTAEHLAGAILEAIQRDRDAQAIRMRVSPVEWEIEIEQLVREFDLLRASDA